MNIFYFTLTKWKKAKKEILLFSRPDEDDAANDENTTQPFQPDDHSTPGPSGEEVPMTTFSRGRARGPESAETSFTEGRTHSQVLDLNEKAWESLTGIFPEAKAPGLEAFFSKTGKLQVKKLGFFLCLPLKKEQENKG